MGTGSLHVWVGVKWSLPSRENVHIFTSTFSGQDYRYRMLVSMRSLKDKKLACHILICQLHT